MIVLLHMLYMYAPYATCSNHQRALLGSVIFHSKYALLAFIWVHDSSD
ncbi:hypothetical protein HMPREF9069_01540 [Atopobium sp. oral taxon 810 str. F0209]|nr:hypothetical protein HMPREF9069_01540 [Atopobium sp. oral taxon 810 str. F0209]